MSRPLLQGAACSANDSTRSAPPSGTAVAKIDALAAAAEQAFDNAIWPPGTDPKQIERIAHLVGASREAAEAALCAVDALNAEICNQSAPSGDGQAW